MPTAICKACGHTRSWRNQRGVRLADMACGCGGALCAATWDAAQRKYVPRSATGKTKGRRRVACAICGCMRMDAGRNVMAPPFPFREPRGKPEVLPAGSIVCWHHQIMPVRVTTVADAVRLYHAAERNCGGVSYEDRTADMLVGWALGEGVVLDDQDMVERVFRTIHTEYGRSATTAMCGSSFGEHMPRLDGIPEGERLY
jgi:hypothetical protein